MHTTWQRLHPWLVAALLVLAILSTMGSMGAVSSTPMQQEATATPATAKSGTPTAEMPTAEGPESSSPVTTTATVTATGTVTATAATTMTATPAEREETADEATTTATPEPLSTDELISMGEEEYARYCAACHQLDGQGIANAYPALDGNPFVTAEDPAGVLRVVFTGRAGMPHFRDYLNEQEIAAAVSYVRNGWSNSASAVTVEEVQSVRAEIYSPSEPIDHDGQSTKEGSNSQGSNSQDGDEQETESRTE